MSDNKETNRIHIDRAKIKEELQQKQVLQIQKELITDRRKRMVLLALLLSALVFTAIYGTIQNPFQYTFSKIGNRFTFANRILFIILSMYTGFAIQSTVLALFNLEGYKNKRHITYILISVGFLLATALAPSLPDLPFWTWVHLITAGLFGLFITLGFYPFVSWVARENPRLTKIIYVWFAVTWGGAIAWYFMLGNTGMFEIWFFILFIVFLLYLSLTLFEERIVKQSILLLKDEENLNVGIEKIFIDLEKESKKKNKS